MSWPTWRAARSAKSSRPCARPWPGAFAPITPFSSVNCWTTSYLDEVIETLSTHIAEVIASFAEEVSRLDTIPGVNKRTAEVLIAEIGVDMGAQL